MDKAPDFGSGDCRFESCHGRFLFPFELFFDQHGNLRPWLSLCTSGPIRSPLMMGQKNRKLPFRRSSVWYHQKDVGECISDIGHRWSGTLGKPVGHKCSNKIHFWHFKKWCMYWRSGWDRRKEEGVARKRGERGREKARNSLKLKLFCT